jgi:hypothetical protein
LLAWVAACGGSVESGDQSKANGGTGGSAVSPAGGAGGSVGDAGSVGGTSFGGALGSSGGGVGGTFGYGGSFGCFVAGTQIATPSGTRPIDELRLGDLVLAYDEQAERVVPRPVVETFVHPDHPVGALPLSDGRVLRVTANHPIYLPDQQRYADAGELTGDERLLTLSGSAQTSSLIAGAFRVSAADPVTVYNISVAGEHNYFAEGVLVHNKSGAGGSGGTGGTRCDPVAWSGACTPTQGCIDPRSPTPERIDFNQPVVGEDAGSSDSGALDAGISDATPRTTVDSSPYDAHPFNSPPPTGGAIGADICGGPQSTRNSYLAFDLWSDQSPPSAVAIHSVNAQCSGAEIGMAPFVSIAPPARTWTTQCVVVPDQSISRVMVQPLSTATVVKNLRFVSDCRCPRPLFLTTSCGTLTPDGGIACRSDWP